jgi:hypothetical protein
MAQKFHSEISLDWLEAEYVYQPKPVPQAHIVSLKDIENDYPELEKGKPLTKQEKAKKAKIDAQVAHMKASK